MNWRWKHILICAFIGLIIGVIAAFTLLSQVSPEMAADMDMSEGTIKGLAVAMALMLPISINFIYWGWKKSGEILNNLIVKLIICIFVGYAAFPIAIFKAVKNAD